jgi:L-seryl-tRNA(Ser) seleniumtransferase
VKAEDAMVAVGPTERAAAGVDGAEAAGPEAFRALPSVLALRRAAREAGSTLGEEALTRLVQEILGRERAAIAAGARPARAEIEERALAAVAELERPRLAPLLNATGVVVHTNLGRAPVSGETAAAMAAAAPTRA